MTARKNVVASLSLVQQRSEPKAWMAGVLRPIRATRCAWRRSFASALVFLPSRYLDAPDKT